MLADERIVVTFGGGGLGWCHHGRPRPALGGHIDSCSSPSAARCDPDLEHAALLALARPTEAWLVEAVDARAAVLHVGLQRLRLRRRRHRRLVLGCHSRELVSLLGGLLGEAQERGHTVTVIAGRG